MTPTILIVGATGNTGKSVVRNLSRLLQSQNSKYRILGLTRSLNSTTSQELAKLPQVEMQEIDWTTIEAAWLKEQDVVKAYIAPHNLPQQFVDESAFFIALLQAKVKYVVKLSTSVNAISPTSPVIYGRSHWAVENLLSQPEFKNLQWTSLQPNIFTSHFLAPAVEWIKQYKKTENQETLNIYLDADTPAAMIDPEDVGNVAAHLLALEDPTSHNQAKYVLAGPEDVNGKQIVKAVENLTEVKVQKVVYKSTGVFEELIASGAFPKNSATSFLAALESLWQGELSLSNSPNSKEINELAPPKRTIDDALKAMLEE
ncbi:hypothetical protein INT46_002218 [Mucor plumbeus]|uniref:NmrA-like domain-containing protein n=1 Tax=Mucor plumbeus TaxID=97098 RepID=A0A8H7V574_9FUNG|nr:hypothetical protein INT46_002218 [Mucor plumbeus]